jgi:2-methylcitrate dehydratase PrpD
MGKCSQQEFTPAAIADPAVLVLRERVTVTPDPSIREDEAGIAIEIEDGRTLQCHIDHAIGGAGRPMTDADIQVKFRGLAEPVLAAAQVDGLLQACDGLEQLEDAGVLGRLAAVPCDT